MTSTTHTRSRHRACSITEGIRTMTTGLHPLYIAAEQRVLNDVELYDHRDTILYAWPNAEEHWQWVIDATIQEIIDWAEAIEKEAR